MFIIELLHDEPANCLHVEHLESDDVEKTKIVNVLFQYMRTYGFPTSSGMTL